MQLNAVPAAVLALVVLGLVAAIGAKISSNLWTQINGSCATCGGAAENTTLAIGEVAGWMPTIGLVLAASLVIGLVVGAFAYFGRQ